MSTDCIFCQKPTRSYVRLGLISGRRSDWYSMHKQCFQDESGFDGLVMSGECFFCRKETMDTDPQKEQSLGFWRDPPTGFWYFHTQCFVDLVGEDWIRDNKQ